MILKFLVRLTILLTMFFAGLVLMLGLTIAGSMPYVEKGLPKYGAPNNNPIYSPIIQLHRDGHGFCSAVVIDGNYALTAAHCLRGEIYGVNESPIQIKDSEGKETKVVARAVAVAGRIDVGLIKGDFTRFQAYRPDFYGFTPTNVPGEYRTCGFPGLQNRVTCTVFVPVKNMGFSIAGTGFLIPGMSGGPVLDIRNNVIIGVNSAATDGFVLVAPILGALGNFGIEP